MSERGGQGGAAGTLKDALGRGIEVARRLLVPVVALLAALGLAYWGHRNLVLVLDFHDQEASALNPSNWLTYGHVLLPLVFFVLCLINRRYGPGLAVGAVVTSWVLVLAMGTWVYTQPQMAWLEAPAFRLPVAASFVGALITGQLVAIYVFDQVRGVPWWRAPFYSALLGGWVFVLLLNWNSILLGDGPWFNRLILQMSIYSIWAPGSLPFYHLMRRFVRLPRSLGGA